MTGSVEEIDERETGGAPALVVLQAHRLALIRSDPESADIELLPANGVRSRH